MRLILTLVLVSLSACAAPVTPSDQRSFALAYLDDEPFAPRATIRFVGPDRIAGQAPCNSYSANLTASLPAFATDGITSTEMACDALAAEGIFFAALAQMTSADLSGDGLILSNDAGRRMVFQPEP